VNQLLEPGDNVFVKFATPDRRGAFHEVRAGLRSKGAPFQAFARL
jgi:hypothetical protein